MSERPDPQDPQEAFAQFLRQFGLTPGADGHVDMNALMEQLQQAMGRLQGQNPGGEGINWSLVKDIARKVTAMAGPDPSVSTDDLVKSRDAVALADLWLDRQMSFERVSAPAVAWSRAEWIEGTFDVWRQLASPVASSFADALGGLLNRGESPLGAMGASMAPLMKMAASGMLAAQVGQALGTMAGDVNSACSLSLPLTKKPVVALLPANIAAFSEGLEQSDADVRLYVALRETARQRLFASVAWLGPQLLALLEHYARGIAIDASAIEEAINEQMGGDLSATDLEQLGETVSGRLFQPVQTPEQQAILARLETLVALVEGWVDDVVATTTAGLMPGAAALGETVRRRRASGGPAEQGLKALLNLELRPRRVRDAANLWAALRTAKGLDERDATWDHPDRLPTPADLDDPLGFVERGGPASEETGGDFDSAAMDAALAELLGEAGPETDSR